MRIFVYGSLMTGHSNHDCLVGAQKIGVNAICGFSMYSLGPYPFIVRCQDRMPIVHGEVYECDFETVKKLDRLEGHPHFYCRETVELVFGDAREAYAYVMTDEYASQYFLSKR